MAHKYDEPLKLPKPKSFYYVATPYSKLDHNQAAQDAARAGILLLKHGLEIYVPVVHGHPFALDMPPQTHEWWMDRCKPMMKAASGLIVVMMKGYNRSEGIKKEIAYFKSKRKPVFYYDHVLDDFFS